MAADYYRIITVDRGQVASGPHLNFPVYLNIVGGADLVAKVRSDAYDIRFYSDVNQTTEYPYMRYFWDTTTGTWRGRVLVTDGVDSAADKDIYMFYGDSGQTTDTQSKSGVWSPLTADFLYRFEDDPAGGTLTNDQGSAGRNATTSGTISRVTGKLGQYAWDFSGSPYATDGDNGSFGTGPFWVHCWLKQDAENSNGAIVIVGEGAANEQRVTLTSTTTVQIQLQGSYSNSPSVSMTQAFNTGSAWQAFDIFFDRPNGKISVALNGTVVGSVTNTATVGVNYDSTGGSFQICGGSGIGDYNGIIDEFLYFRTLPTNGFVQTLYNSENSPSTFYSVGTENLVGAPGGGMSLVNGGLIRPGGELGMHYAAKNTVVEFGYSVNGTDGAADTISSATVFCRIRGDSGGTVTVGGTSNVALDTYAGAYIAKVDTSNAAYTAGDVLDVFVTGTVETKTTTAKVGEVTLSALADIESINNADNNLAFIEVTGAPTTTSIPSSAVTLGDNTALTLVANQFDGYWLFVNGEMCRIASHTTGATPTFTLSTSSGEALKAAPSSGEKIPIVGRTA